MSPNKNHLPADQQLREQVDIDNKNIKQSKLLNTKCGSQYNMVQCYNRRDNNQLCNTTQIIIVNPIPQPALSSKFSERIQINDASETSWPFVKQVDQIQ